MFIILFLLLTGALIYFPNRSSSNPNKVILDLFQVIFIIYIPLVFFIFSIFVAPEWKAKAVWGAFDLFSITKTILLPFVLWAIVSLYATEVVRLKKSDTYRIMLGLFSGTIISSVSIIYGLVLFIRDGLAMQVAIMLVLAYIPIWYSIRFWNMVKTSKLSRLSYIYVSLCQLPFWLASIYGARELYSNIPETPPDCFVATASSKGYKFIIGELVLYGRNGSMKKASMQMIYLWKFESIWKNNFSTSHRYFRYFYNIWGRRLASYINNRFIATTCFFLLKPVEWVARLVIIFHYQHNRN